jgi:undecaprenyl pyrophosphate phosphatase UppP
LALADSGQKAGLMLIACAIAAATGFLSLKILYKSIAAKRFWQFGLYCIPAGLLATALLLIKLHGAT